METKQTGSNLPEKKFRAGGVTATIWKNQVKTKDGRDAEYLSVTFKRAYKDKETDEWKETNSLKTADLPKAVVVLNKAYEYAVLTGQDSPAVGM
jgi:hypothetical protein